MKILRERRGFTTNSSSASEWSSTPKEGGTGKSLTPPAPPPLSSGQGPLAKQTPLPIGAEVSLKPETPSAVPQSASQSQSQSQGASGFVELFSSSTVGLIGLAGLVAGAGVVERIFRKVLARRKGDDQ